MLTLYDPEISAEYGQTESIVFCQLRYWLERATKIVDGVAWVYKSARELSSELGLSEQRVRRALAHLCAAGLLQRAKLAAQKCRHVYYYCLPKPSAENDKSMSSEQSDRSDCSDDIDPIDLIASNTEITVPKITGKDHSHSPESERNFEAEELEQEIVVGDTPNASPPTPQIAQAPSSQPEDLPRFSPVAKKASEFTRWLFERARRLGKNDPVSWAATVARNPDPIILEQFMQQKTDPPTQERSPDHAPYVPGDLETSPTPDKDLPTPEQHLARLLAKWNMPVPWSGKLRREVAEEILQNPQWGLTFDPESGPKEMEF